VDQEQKPRERSFIRELVPDWHPTREQKLWAVRIAIVLVVVLGILTFIGLPFGITLWEWLKLLAVPITVGAAVPLLNWLQKKRELDAGQLQKERELEVENQSVQDAAREPRWPGGGSAGDPGEQAAAVEPPSDDMMRLTIPRRERIKNDEIPTGLGTDETLFHDYAGVHLKHTGYPWEEANVYIAGHRLGYQNTNSYLAFWDLNKLENGDKIYITDSEGRKYTYVVFKKFIATPDNLSVLNPVDGKNIVTLQTCTLPDYTNRLLVQGELKDIQGS
jgi:sortase A